MTIDLALRFVINDFINDFNNIINIDNNLTNNIIVKSGEITSQSTFSYGRHFCSAIDLFILRLKCNLSPPHLSSPYHSMPSPSTESA